MPRVQVEVSLRAKGHVAEGEEELVVGHQPKQLENNHAIRKEHHAFHEFNLRRTRDAAAQTHADAAAVAQSRAALNVGLGKDPRFVQGFWPRVLKVQRKFFG